MRLVITYYRQNFFNIIFHSYLSTKCHEISHNLLSIYIFFLILFFIVIYRQNVMRLVITYYRQNRSVC